MTKQEYKKFICPVYKILTPKQKKIAYLSAKYDEKDLAKLKSKQLSAIIYKNAKTYQDLH